MSFSYNTGDIIFLDGASYGQIGGGGGGGITEIPQATDSTLGGIIAANKTADDTTECKIDATTGKLYTNTTVPDNTITLQQLNSSLSTILLTYEELE